MSLRQRINDDVKQAMRAGDKPRLKLLRMVTAAIKQREVDERIELDEAQVLAVVEKMIKQRRESAEQYRAGDRPELAEAEEAEIVILQDYLPEPLSEEALAELIDEAISEVDAGSMADMGKVMGLIKSRVQGRADMGKVSAQVRGRLAGQG
ncbi:GatB/YqeY domain-containing protein [Wenzhouxiangella sp. AB-CW3]|uniref:GatB/YqeY domain-containing protein n=1 Tax=Wenzhouxiangella sp. AB-CW3 TaxID=2771012 RepID=UPI00168BD81B|nr:GatB/YqeY domain-containing protein [Wenzhouxiangella sp. AB-CW3]QOC22853.1 GatB/YqeY domain-containing protein [Wenzhouxiangella sp. AB-CW3]